MPPSEGLSPGSVFTLLQFLGLLSAAKLSWELTSFSQPLNCHENRIKTPMNPVVLTASFSLLLQLLPWHWV